MKKMLKRLCTGFLALATVVTALPTTPVHAESKQYWTESAERVGIIEKVMNDGSIGSTFNEGYMKVEGETAYCIDINTDFKNGYKTRTDASSRMSADQISDVALSLEYVKQYGEAHKELNYKQVYLLEQCVVWQRLSVHLGWQCDNVRASYDEIPKATQDEVFSGAKAFVKENKGRYECDTIAMLPSFPPPRTPNLTAAAPPCRPSSKNLMLTASFCTPAICAKAADCAIFSIFPPAAPTLPLPFCLPKVI